LLASWQGVKVDILVATQELLDRWNRLCARADQLPQVLLPSRCLLGIDGSTLQIERDQ